MKSQSFDSAGSGRQNVAGMHAWDAIVHRPSSCCCPASCLAALACLSFLKMTTLALCQCTASFQLKVTKSLLDTLPSAVWDDQPGHSCLPSQDLGAETGICGAGGQGGP